uniref:Uncharacterized protein n=1 Tax=Setaria italica TaxID=4555 RepID=K4A4L5_SETIT
MQPSLGIHEDLRHIRSVATLKHEPKGPCRFVGLDQLTCFSSWVHTARNEAYMQVMDVEAGVHPPLSK